jgi:hypothetical protein
VNKITHLCLLLALAEIQLACDCSPNQKGKEAELVMSEGSKIEARAPGGNIRVLAGPGFRRTYQWDQCELVAHPCPRSERWHGRLGIYDPAPGMFYWHSCQGISRPVFEEEQLHFRSTEDAERWLSRYIRIFPDTTVYRDDGLVVQWRITPQRQQFSADVFQLCIEGRKPSGLVAAEDGAITMVSGNGQLLPTKDCANVPERVMDETMRAYEELWGPSDTWRGAATTVH